MPDSFGASAAGATSWTRGCPRDAARIKGFAGTCKPAAAASKTTTVVVRK